VLLAVASLAIGCARAATVASSSAATPACTFANPLGAGADPWVVRRGSTYYYVKSQDRRIWIASADRLADATTAPPRAVWTAPDTGWNRTNIWAPELHSIDGRWYIY
jgi:GH43 family beta-xylosidase